MPRTVLDGFAELLSRLEPPPVEQDARVRHKTTIEQALRAEFPDFNRVFVFGSHTRATAIKHFSDVDYMGQLGVGDVTWGNGWVSSTSTLARVKRALEARLPNTKVRADGPSVVVHFNQGEGAVDVVPGVWTKMTDTDPRRPIYVIPDGNGGWRQTSPQFYADYIVGEDDQRARGKLCRTIKLLKAWKYARAPAVPLFGFHLEMLLAQSDCCVGVKSYQNCLLDGLRLLRDRQGAALNDPFGIGGRIDAVSTEAQRVALVDAARHGVEKAASAIQAELDGRTDDAFYYWNLVFNREFPAR